MSEVLDILWQRRAFFAELFVQHMMICAVAIIASLILGVTLGTIAARKNSLRAAVLGSANFVYTIPSISMLGFLIPLTGIGNATAIVALTIYGLLPIVRSTYTGLTGVDPILIEAARGMGATRKQLLWRVQFPLAMPVIISGLRNMVVMTIALAGIASFVGAGGLGVAIYRGITLNNTALAVAGSLLIAVFALVADALVGLLARIRKPGRWLKVAVPAIAAVALVVAATLNHTGANTIKMATKPMTEQYILSEIVKQKVERETDLHVKVTAGVGGGTANIQPGMVKGDFDLYPEYTGTGWAAVLKRPGTYTEADFTQMQQAYEKQFQMEWLSPFGFENTYAIAVPKALAEQYHLRYISDLAPIAGQLTLGAEPDFFERADGFNGLTKRYGLHFGGTKDLDIGLKYDAIRSGQIQVLPVFTTDGQLADSNLVVLKDNLHFYPSYNCAPVVRMETLEKYPQLRKILGELAGRIDAQSMARMNNEVEKGGKTPAQVATEFLKKLEGEGK